MGDEALIKYPGLYARDNGAWYVRKRVPTDLVGLETRGQIRLSLETADRKTAIKRYPSKLAEIEAHFDGLRNRLQRMGPIESALAVGKLEQLGQRELELIVSDWWRAREDARRPTVEHTDDLATLVAEIEEDVRHLGGDPTNNDTVRGVVDALLLRAGIAAKPLLIGSRATSVRYPTVDRQTPSYRYLCELVARGLAAEATLAKDHVLGRRDSLPDPIFNRECGSSTSVTTGGSRRLADLFDAYAAERAALYSEQSTEKKYGFVFRIMEEVLGRDRLVSSLTRADCVQVLAFMKRLPPNATKRFPLLSLSEAAAKADTDQLGRIAPNTVASYMQALAAALRWADDAGWNVKINMRDLTGSREAQVKRRGFRPEELEILFGSLTAFRILGAARACRRWSVDGKQSGRSPKRTRRASASVVAAALVRRQRARAEFQTVCVLVLLRRHQLWHPDQASTDNRPCRFD